MIENDLQEEELKEETVEITDEQTNLESEK